jgi:hypothetical protein
MMVPPVALMHARFAVALSLVAPAFNAMAAVCFATWCFGKGGWLLAHTPMQFSW